MSVKMKIRVTKEILERSSMCNMFRDIDGKVKRIGDSLHSYYAANNEVIDVASNCAIALAVREIFPFASVGNYTIQPFANSSTIGWRYIHDIRLPDEASDFVNDFDNAGGPITRQMMPELEFEVEIPNSVIEMIEIPDLSEYLKESKTLELV